MNIIQKRLCLLRLAAIETEQQKLARKNEWLNIVKNKLNTIGCCYIPHYNMDRNREQNFIVTDEYLWELLQRHVVDNATNNNSNNTNNTNTHTNTDRTRSYNLQGKKLKYIEQYLVRQGSNLYYLHHINLTPTEWCQSDSPMKKISDINEIGKVEDYALGNGEDIQADYSIPTFESSILHNGDDIDSSTEPFARGQHYRNGLGLPTRSNPDTTDNPITRNNPKSSLSAEDQALKDKLFNIVSW